MWNYIDGRRGLKVEYEVRDAAAAGCYIKERVVCTKRIITYITRRRGSSIIIYQNR